MPGGLDLRGWVGGAQFTNLIQHLAQSALFRGVEALMDLAVALRIGGVSGLGGREVSNPVEDRLRAAEHNIDRVVGGQIANVPIGVIDDVINDRVDLETRRCATKRDLVVLAVTAIGIF